MAEGIIHKHLKALGMKFLKEKCTDVVSREVKVKNIKSIADVMGINIKRKEVRVIECKATKADYIRDIKLMNIDESYYKHCQYFYILCPIDVIPLDIIPIEYGVLYADIDNNNITVMRNPKKYTGRLKTMFDTCLKNAIKSNTNDLIFHYVFKEYNIELNYKKSKKSKRRK